MVRRVLSRGTISMSKSIKAINPDYKMMFYWNSCGYWGAVIDSFSEDWLKFTLDAKGHRVYEDDKSCNRRLYNHNIPEMRKWWVNHTLMMDNDDAIYGIFADATRSPEDTLYSGMIKHWTNQCHRVP